LVVWFFGEFLIEAGGIPKLFYRQYSMGSTLFPDGLVINPETRQYRTKKNEQAYCGSSAKEIATNLHISPHTVETHRKNILQKSDCTNTAQLIANCLTGGVINIA